jgi:hypothetical protein
MPAWLSLLKLTVAMGLIFFLCGHLAVLSKEIASLKEAISANHEMKSARLP